MKTEGPVFGRGVVRNGRLRIDQSNVFAAQLQSLRDGVVEISIERKRATRSQQANRYWWGVCVALVSEHTGYSPDEVHELAKQMFLPKRLAVADGNGEVKGEFVIGGSTSKLSTVQFGEFIERYRLWSAETLGVEIPLPDGGGLE